MKRRENITVLISDHKCAYFTEQDDMSLAFYDNLELPEGVVVNGYIKEPVILFELLQASIKKHQFKIRNVNILIHDQNLLIRNVTISKEELQRKTINQYMHEQTDKKVYFPFEKAAISQHIQHEDEKEVKALALITDEDLLHDYYDIFEKLGAKEVSFDLPSLALYELYKADSKTTANNIMLVTIYSSLLAIQIFSNHMPIFQMIEECDGSNPDRNRILENYIERIANYYKFNVTKGEKAVEDVVIYNLSDTISNEEITEHVIPTLTDFKTSLFSVSSFSDHHKDMPVGCILPYATIISQKENVDLPFEFELERIKRVNIYGNYLMVIAFLIFTTVSLLYIPFYLGSEDIINQQNINQSLQNQLNTIIQNQEDDPVYSDVQITYNDMYTHLLDLEMSYKTYIEDLTSDLDSNLLINSVNIDAQEKSITILISSSTSKVLLDEYALYIYETYGVSDLEDDQNRWIVSEPETTFKSDLIMEVVIYYA